jgi:hypothetical protein
VNPIVPDAVLNQHIAVLGKTGVGKSYAAKAAIVEPALVARRRVGVVDPTGAWWGLRSSRDGKGPGFPVLVLGGDHGDVPLPANSGAAVARLLVEQGVNLVADTSQLTVGERTRWMIDFAGSVYRLNRTPLALVLDEAHVFAPQGGGGRMDVDVGKMLHVVNQLASGGRSRGIRLTMITQRPQKLHKDSLTTADTLIAMRVLAPQDRAAVKAWIDGCADPKKGIEVLDSLAGLARGEGWVWYPEGGFLHRTKFPAIKTFDSSATPVDGQAAPAPKAAAEIDLTEVKKAMAEAIKEAEANDPKLLRAKIAHLEFELKKRPTEKVLAVDHDAANVARAVAGKISELNASLSRLSTEFGTVQLQLHDIGMPRAGSAPANPQLAPKSKLTQMLDTAPAAGANGQLPRAERLILTALAQYAQGRSTVQVAVLTGYAVNGGGFRNALGALRGKGFISGRGENLTITQAGARALGAFDPLPCGRELLDYWRASLGKAEREILTVLAGAYPASLKVHEVGERAGYAPDGGGFRNALGRLRTLELIAGRGELRASDNLFG